MTAGRNRSRRPGARRRDTHSMIRVDQAGEFGAAMIYRGQLAVLGTRHPAAREIARMKAQEERHLAAFDALMRERKVRPTLLQPLWRAAGFGLGAATALLGPEAAMACTAAIETEIDRHYGEQLDALGDEDGELSSMVARFRVEEVEHRDRAIEAGAERAFAWPLLSGMIRSGCRAAIALSKRI